MKELVGRSRNERKLDGIYNKQRDILIHQYKSKRVKNKDIYTNLSKRKANETIPFPEIYEKKRKIDKIKLNSYKVTVTRLGNVKSNYNTPNNIQIVRNNGEIAEHSGHLRQMDMAPQNNRSNNNITLYKGIHMIIYKHIYSKTKFVKSLSLFINLCINYLNNENKNVFFFAFDKIVKVFLQNYIHDDNQNSTHLIYTVYNDNELHIKCMISLFDKVINKIIDNRFLINNNTTPSVAPIKGGKESHDGAEEASNDTKNGCSSYPPKNDLLPPHNGDRTDERKFPKGDSLQMENAQQHDSAKWAIANSDARGEGDSDENNDVSSDKNNDVSSDKNNDVSSDKNNDMSSDKNNDVSSDKNNDVSSDKNNDMSSDKNNGGRNPPLHDNTEDNRNKQTNEPSKVIISKREKKYLKALKIKVYYLIILYKLNDNFVFNKLISIYRQIFQELLGDYDLFEETLCQEKLKPSIVEEQVVSNCTKENSAPRICDFTTDNNEIVDDENFLIVLDKWTLPNDYEIFKIKRNAFVKCMSKLYNFINVKWASTLVESLLLDVYLKKYIFDTCDEIVIEKLQSAAKLNMNKRKNKFHSPHVLSIGESLNPVVDARDEKIVSLHGSHVWSTKQMEH
ncbi:hypothetical protein, conserved [Plasmodium gonderi]|uniref:Protein phosphatase 2C n=1 Tax=Plasmodium gonderi TaxID=77519 RepID=A0A1Y1JAF7_PLAGO|nr:hypothetical protein, conserved [Plasmodium gonderi]GAW79240.1 hypothetical protein, conserved [Plasmodium gonderi]